MNKIFAVAGLLGLLLQYPFITTATPINGLYVFGDSLSDQGNVSSLTGGSIPGPNYYDGRFSNGPVYTDFLGQALGFPLTPGAIYPTPWTPGSGNDLSYGGARTDRHRSGLPLGLNSQVAAFINGVTTADSESLYVVFAGANDIQDAIGVADDDPAVAAAALNDPATAIASVQDAARNVASSIAALNAAGAVRFFVPNGPNWAVVPAVLEIQADNPVLLNGYNEFTRDTSVAFSDQLAIELDALGASASNIDIISFDFFSLLEDLVVNGADYGFTDVTSPCYQGDFSSGTTCANPAEHLFWDREHPTTIAHAIVASRFASAIPVPGMLALFMICLPGLLFSKYRKRKKELKPVAA